MKLLRTAFDIDGIFCKTEKVILDDLNEQNGLNLRLEDWVLYSAEESFSLNKDVVRKAVDTALAKDSIYRIPINDVAIWTVCEIYSKTRKKIPFITSRKSKEDTEYFLDRCIVKGRFPYELRYGVKGSLAWVTKLHHMNDMNCNIIVEDAPDTCDFLVECGKVVLLYDRVYNRYATNGLRFSNWEDVYNFVLVAEKL